MKKVLLAVCLIFLAVIITACGGGGKSNPPSYPFIPPVPPEPVGQNLELSQKIFNLNIGDTDNIIVILNGEDVTQQVTYTPDDEAIATVENGTITALAQGTTTVTVSHQGANDVTFTVNVIDPTLPTLEVSQDTFALKVGETDNVIVTLEGEDVTETVNYTPDDESIATVENGIITALSQGSTTVTVSFEGANNVVFTVNVDLPDLELSKTSYELGLGEEDTITVTCNGTDVTESAVYTLDNNLITVEKGNIKALYKAGETIVTVSLEGANSATFTVKVIDDSDEEVPLDNDILNKLFELNFVDKDSEHKSELTELNFPGAFIYSDGKKYKIISIPDGMFNGCASLESIEIPNSVTTIGDSAFSGTPIKEITIPDSVTSLGYAFVGCTSLEKITIGNGVTTIQASQFSSINGLTSLKTVIIGNSVTTIGDAAFNGTKIESIEIPNSVTTIGNSAFSGTPIKEITIPDSVTSLGYAFTDCKSLEKITIGNGVTTIQGSQFSSYNGLTSLKTVIIGNSVTTIVNDAFSGTPIKEITIPDSVTSLGYAFNGCTSLEKITIGNGVTTIQDGQFSSNNGLTSLKTVIIGNSVTTIGNSAFYGTKIESIEIPNSVTTIGDCAFQATPIKEITIPDSVTSLGYAFNDCRSLEKITIGNGVTTIQGSQFSSNNGLTSLKTVIIGNSVTTIEGGAFSGTPIKEITIPDSVTSLGYAFDGCKSLEKITIGNGVTTIQGGQFSSNNGLKSLKTVIIGNSVTTIKDGAFSGTKIESIEIPNSVTTIGNSAFSGTPIKEITIPDSVTSLGYAFDGCKSLEKITIGNGLTEIKVGLFSGLSALKTVKIGNGVKSIGSGAFNDCTSLELTLPDQVETIDNNAFSGIKCICYTNKLKALPAPSDYWGANDHKVIQ